MKILDWITNRLAEASTWRGIVSIVTACGVALSPDQADKIIAAGLAIIGAINVFRKQPESTDSK